MLKIVRAHRRRIQLLNRTSVSAKDNLTLFCNPYIWGSIAKLNAMIVNMDVCSERAGG